MARWKVTLLIINIFISTFFVAIRLVNENSFGSDSFKPIASFLVCYRLELVIFLGLANGILSAIVVLFLPKKAMRDFRDSLANTIFEQLLDNNKNETRITIFGDARWLRCWAYRFKDFVGLFRHNEQMEIYEIITYCWNSYYVVIYKRWGNNHNNSKTYFRFNPHSPDNCQGVAGIVRQKDEEMVAILPDISDLNLNEVDKNNPKIKEYMEEGSITDFRVLKGLNKPPQHIYGNSFSTRGGKKKLVLVIDSWQKKSPFIDKEAKKALRSYTKLLSTTYGGKKNESINN